MPPSSSPPPPSPSPPPPAKAATGPAVGPGAIPGKICATSQPVLLVTGAARSGTSALAHLLHLQGAYAGELNSKYSDDRHPNIGSYELNALTRLLSAMLASRKQSWLNCQELVVPNASDRRNAALLQAARSLACVWPRCCAASPPTRRSRRRSGPRRPARHGRPPARSSEIADNSN